MKIDDIGFDETGNPYTAQKRRRQTLRPETDVDEDFSFKSSRREAQKRGRRFNPHMLW